MRHTIMYTTSQNSMGWQPYRVTCTIVCTVPFEKRPNCYSNAQQQAQNIRISTLIGTQKYAHAVMAQPSSPPSIHLQKCPAQAELIAPTWILQTLRLQKNLLRCSAAGGHMLRDEIAHRLPPVRRWEKPFGTVCLLFYILATSKGHIRMGTDLWQCALIATLHPSPLGNQAVSTMTWYPTQSHYPDIAPTSPCPIPIMPSTWLVSDTYQLYKSLDWLDQG